MKEKRAINNVELNGFSLNTIGIGTWKMGGFVTPSFSKRNDRQEIDAIKYSVEKGQNHIDTAELYGAGKAEKLIATAIKELGIKRNSVFIASKIWSHHRKRKDVVKGVEKILKRLETDYLDMIYIHFPWDLMEEYMSGLSDAVDEGLARGLAVSNFNLEQLKRSQVLARHPILANQVLFNVFERSVTTDDLLTYCQKENILVVAYTPVENIFKKGKNGQILQEIAKKYDRSLAQIAINWLISQDNVVTIPKATSPAHIDDNLQALNFKLAKEDMLAIKNLGEYRDKIW